MTDLAAIDTHAHIDVTVTEAQIRALGDRFVLAMTRTPEDAAAAASRSDARLVWGCGIHPRLVARTKASEVDVLLNELAPRFAVIGEIGLDGRGADPAAQRQFFAACLSVATRHPTLISVHSTGAVDDVLEELERQPHPGLILHWFSGTIDQTRRAVALGAYFSVNAAMPVERIRALPRERVLTETDYPFTARKGVALPGAVESIEDDLAGLWGTDQVSARRQATRNFRDLATRSGAIEVLPEAIADHLLVA